MDDKALLDVVAAAGRRIPCCDDSRKICPTSRLETIMFEDAVLEIMTNE